jgi:hypothetical protein
VGGCQYLIEYTTKDRGIGNDIIQITSISRLTTCNPIPDLTTVKRLAYVDLIQLLDDDQEQQIIEEGMCTQAITDDNIEEDIELDDVYYIPIDRVAPGSLPVPSNFDQIFYNGDSVFTFQVYEYYALCGGETCCRAYFEIRKEDNDFIDNIAFNYSFHDQGDCDTLFNCSNTCDDLYFDWNDSLGLHYPDLLKQSLEEDDSKIYIDQNKIKISPNPANEKILVSINDFDNNSSQKFIIIYDVNGNEQFRKEVFKHSSEFDISTLESGIYFVCYQNDINKYYLKFIKE